MADVAVSPKFHTFMTAGAVDLEDVRRKVRETMQVNADVLQQFHEIWYNATFTWGMTTFAGIGCAKCTTDLWMYQEIINEHRPRTIIETGTYKGGSSLYFAFLLEVLGIDGHVHTIDIRDQRDPRAQHPRVTFHETSSIDPAFVKRLAERIEYPLLVSLDSEHTSQHVRDELGLYGALCQVGDWLVIEDTNISWASDGGARHGAEGYLRAHPGEWVQDLLRERYLITMHPGGWWRRVGACPHHARPKRGPYERRRVGLPDLSKAER